MRKSSWHTFAHTHPETQAQIKNPYIPLAYLSLEHSCRVYRVSIGQRVAVIPIGQPFGVFKIYDHDNNHGCVVVFPLRK